MTKEELIQLSKTSFFDNNVGGISAADHRGFNEALINSVAELVGIDYSLLTEQVVPGEFWANRNGIGKKQVYTRTFVITTNPAGQGQLLMTGIDILIDTRISYNYPQTIMNGSTLELMYTYAIDTGSGGFYLTTLYPSFAGKATVVSIKYTKR